MKSNIQRISRAAVCLVLVCCLIVNISPVRACATTAGGTAAASAAVIGIPATLAIATGVIGLGVYAGLKTDALDGVVNGAVYDESLAEYIINDTINAVKCTYPDGTVSWLLPLSFLETLRDWLFDSDVVTESSFPFIGEFNVSFNGGSYSIVANNPCIVLCFKAVVRNAPYSWLWYFSRDMGNFSFNGNSVQAGYSYVSGLYSRSIASASSDVSVSGVPVVDSGSFDSVSEFESFCKGYSASSIGSVITSEDLTLGDVGTADQTVTEAFPTWTSGATTFPGTDTGLGTDEEWIPVGLPSDYESALNKTQSDVQSGVSEYVDTGGDLTPDDGDDTQNSGMTMADVTVTAFLGKLLADLTKVLFGTGTLTLTELFGSTWTELQALGKTISENFTTLKTELATGFKNLATELTSSLTEILDTIKALPEAIAAAFDYFFECLLEGIEILPEAMKKVLTDIFVPSSDYITAKVDTIRGKFLFMDSIIATGEYIRDSLSGSSGPPAIYVDLTLADGDIDYGEKTLLTDFSWYAPYKGTVDSVLGAALWAFFGWRVFLRLPGLISGADGYVGEIRTLSSRSSGAGGRKKED